MARRDTSWITRYQLHRWGLAAFLLVAVAGVRVLRYRPPPETAAYFQRVVAAADATPSTFGSWVSVETPVPPSAITMLRPNLAMSRRYANLQTGQQASFLLVQCSDARNLLGHYPPICYVSNGFRPAGATPRDWQVEGLAIHGMVYTFAPSRLEDATSMIVYDFMIVPDGRTYRDMGGVNAAARDPRRRQLGAAQLQVLLDASMPEDQREVIFLALVQAHRRTIDTILAGDL